MLDSLPSDVENVLETAVKNDTTKAIDLTKIAQDSVVKSLAPDAIKVEGNGAVGEVVEYVKYDETDDKLFVERRQDVEPALNDAKERHNSGFHGDEEFKLAGRFPVVLIHEWLRQRNLTMSDFKGEVINEFLDDPDHKYFRIWPGRVGNHGVN